MWLQGIGVCVNFAVRSHLQAHISKPRSLLSEILAAASKSVDKLDKQEFDKRHGYYVRW